MSRRVGSERSEERIANAVSALIVITWNAAGRDDLMLSWLIVLFFVGLTQLNTALLLQ